jgi:hypothetical protein
VLVKLELPLDGGEGGGDLQVVSLSEQHCVLFLEVPLDWRGAGILRRPLFRPC